MKSEIVVIDGQGGGLGKQLVSELRKSCPDLRITAVGTNSLATLAMRKAGADQCATGENAVLVAARRADLILGPIGIVIADALLGEITAPMAVAIGQSSAQKILIRVNQCGNHIVGVVDPAYGRLVAEAVAAVRRMQETND